MWAAIAGGGGLRLLWTKGPWRLTNGWFAYALDRVVLEKIRGGQSVGLDSAFARYALLCCGENCLEDGNVTSVFR